MKLSKKAYYNIIVFIIVATIVAFVVWKLAYGGINKGSNNVINPIKTWLNMDNGADTDKQKEEQRVGMELLQNAVDIYNKIDSVVVKCIGQNSKNGICVCDIFDFTKLSDYNIKITSEGGIQMLELLDSRKVPVPEKRIALGNFLIGPLLAGSVLPSDTIDNYKKSLNYKYIIISGKNIIYNHGDTEYQKDFSTMNQVNFIKPVDGAIVMDENNYGNKKCTS